MPKHTTKYERLKQLGEEKFQKIVNDLMRGQPAMGVARIIQQEWHDLQDVAEKTLTQQLSRLRIDIGKKAFGWRAAKKLENNTQPKLPVWVKDSSLKTLEEMLAVASIQRERIERLVAKERAENKHLTVLNSVLADYVELWEKIQKVRFDLGLDVFKGPTNSFKASQTTVITPEGAQLVHKQVYSAYSGLKDILDKRQIPEVIEAGH